ELARAVLEADHATHLAIADAEAGQQVDRSVALVLELAPRWSGPGRWSTWRWRLVGRRRLANPDARFLVDAEQWTIGRWIQQQFDDRHGFGGEVGIAIVHPGVKDGPGEPGAA